MHTGRYTWFFWILVALLLPGQWGCKRDARRVVEEEVPSVADTLEEGWFERLFPKGDVVAHPDSTRQGSLLFVTKAPNEPVWIYGGAWVIYVSGRIGEDSAERLEQILKWGDIPGRSYLYLDVTGTDYASAMAFGRAVRRAGLYTNIGTMAVEPSLWGSGVCEDACMLAFIGGLFRSVSRRSVARFTGPFPPALKEALTAYLEEMGVDPFLYEHVRVESDKRAVVEISDLELKALKIDRGYADETVWELREAKDRLYLHGMRQTKRGTQKLMVYCFNRRFIVQAYFDAEGHAEAIMELMNAHSLHIDGSYLPIEPDSLISKEEVNGYISVAFYPDEDQLERLHQAKRVGVICQMIWEAPVFYGFDDMDFEKGAVFLPSVARACY